MSAHPALRGPGIHVPATQLTGLGDAVDTHLGSPAGAAAVAAVPTSTPAADADELVVYRGGALQRFLARTLTAKWLGGLTGEVARSLSATLSDAVSIKAFGAVGDSIRISGTSSITAGQTQFTHTNAAFQTTDIGKRITIPGAGTAGGVLRTTITGRTSNSVITLADAAETTLAAVTSNVVHYGTDDTTAVQAAATYAFPIKRKLYIPKGLYWVTSPIACTWFGIEGEGRETSVLLFDSATADAALIDCAIPNSDQNNGTFARRVSLARVGGGSNQRAIFYHSTTTTSRYSSFHAFDDLRLLDWSGYAIYFNEYYAQGMNFNSIHISRCAGFVSGDNIEVGSDNLNVTCCSFTNIYYNTLTAGTNKDHLIDLRTFREVLIRNIVVEGSNPGTTPSSVFRTGSNEWVDINGFHYEITGVGQPTYWLYTDALGYNLGAAIVRAKNITTNLKISINRLQSKIEIWNWLCDDSDLTTKIEASVTDHTVTIDGRPRFFFQRSFAQIGRVRTTGVSYTGLLTSETDAAPLVNYRGGHLLSALRRGPMCGSIGTSATKRNGIRSDPVYGRVWETGGFANGWPVINLTLDVPPELVGANFVWSIVYRMPNGDPGGSYQGLLTTSFPANTFGKISDAVKSTSWTWGRANGRLIDAACVLSNAGGAAPTSPDVRIQIASYYLSVGSDLPPLLPYGLPLGQATEWWDTAVPTFGDYVVGDRVWNSSVAVSGTLCWICTTAGAACATAWANGATIVIGDQRHYLSNVYQAATAGTAATGSEPTGTTTSTGADTIQWVYQGPLAVFTARAL